MALTELCTPLVETPAGSNNLVLAIKPRKEEYVFPIL
jgi:hypothetical protein